MLDTHRLIREALLTQSSITSIASVITYPDLPKNTDILGGTKAVTFFSRGPADNPELPAFDDQSIQVKTWALKMTDAMAVFGAVCDFLDQAQQIDVAPHGVIISGFREMPPQPMFDPDTGWATVTGFFRLAMRAN